MALGDVISSFGNAGVLGTTIGKYLFNLFILAVVVGGFTALSVWFFRLKQYKWIVRIYEEEPKGTGRYVEKETDKGAIILDKKTQNRLFLLKSVKCGLAPDDIPYLVGPKSSKIVNLLRTGLKSYRYLQVPKVTSNSPISLEYGVHDQDIAWALNEIERSKMYEKKSTLQQIMPVIGMAFVFVTIVAVTYFFFVKAGFNADLLKDLAASAESISKNMVAAQTGTVVTT